MTQTLQEALLQAGLVSKEKKERNEKRQAPRGPRKVKQEASPSVLHEQVHEHHIRTECEACKKTGPDVEYYEHRNRLVNVKWLCLKCADTHRIPDETRQTEQSQFARGGRFIREYGATKVFR